MLRFEESETNIGTEASFTAALPRMKLEPKKMTIVVDRGLGCVSVPWAFGFDDNGKSFVNIKPLIQA